MKSQNHVRQCMRSRVSAGIGLAVALLSAGAPPGLAQTGAAAQEVVALAKPCLNLRRAPGMTATALRCLPPGQRLMKRDPVVACMTDLFTRPAPMSVDVAFDVADQIDKIVAMLACHRSQVFEWLPHEEGILDKVPTDPADKREWLRTWYTGHIRIRADRFRQSLIATWGEKRGRAIEYAEVYEISEYATQPDEPLRRRLFPCFERERRSVAGTPDV